MRASARQPTFWPWDALFLICAACYAWLAFTGIIPLSGAGAVLDSDLMTYAQGMAGESHPELFASDPVLKNTSAANSIRNLERYLATWLAPPNQWATGLLLTGSLTIFIFYAAWYFLGRWLYGSPALAALLAVACGITVWVGWGTFWGISHSDPVPRVLFGAFMPILIFLGVAGANRAFLRPVAMFAAGMLIWVHGVSALNCGAMLFTAFALIRARGTARGSYILNLGFCLAAFFTPVLVFLWPSLFQPRQFTAAELAVFHELMEMRWHADFSGFGTRMMAFFSPFSDFFPILAGGVAAWTVTIFKGNFRERTFCRMCPCFVIALLLVAAFCWLETRFSMSLGRLPMGHELVRGMRFLIPLAWVCLVAGIGCLTGPWPRRLILGLTFVCAISFSADRQYMAAQYAITRLTGIRLPLSANAEEEADKASRLRSFLEEVRKTVPAGECIYSPEDAMQLRYMAHRPLAHSFKDGYVHFYNKDLEGSQHWLKLEKLARSSPDGWLKAWQASGAPWLLARTELLEQGMPIMPGRIVLQRYGWTLVRGDESGG